jgi:hypothetical protein
MNYSNCTRYVSQSLLIFQTIDNHLPDSINLGEPCSFIRIQMERHLRLVLKSFVEFQVRKFLLRVFVQDIKGTWDEEIE